MRRTADSLAVDLATVTGTGVGGRIRPVDVRVEARLAKQPDRLVSYFRAVDLLRLALEHDGRQALVLLDVLEEDQLRAVAAELLTLSRHVLLDRVGGDQLPWLHHVLAELRPEVTRLD